MLQNKDDNMPAAQTDKVVTVPVPERQSDENEIHDDDNSWSFGDTPDLSALTTPPSTTQVCSQETQSTI